MESKLIVAGVLALDDLKTPKRREKGIVGGAGVYSSIASNFFTNTVLVAAIGNDFPKNIYNCDLQIIYLLSTPINTFIL